MERLRIFLGIPGPSADWATINAALEGAEKHDVILPRGVGHGTCGNFDELWCEANNGFEDGDCDLYLKLHSDVYPADAGWIDEMVGVMLARKMGMVSTPIAVKDGRDLVSCGLADSGEPFRTFMLQRKVLARCPEDFDAKDLGHPDKILMHNNGCLLIDLRDERWRKTRPGSGNMHFDWNFPRFNCRGENGRWQAKGNSEDFAFSRLVWQAGIPSCITRRVRIWHRGDVLYANFDTGNGVTITAHTLPQRIAFMNNKQKPKPPESPMDPPAAVV